MAIKGTDGGDDLTGTTGNDTFQLRDGGSDTAFGDDGNDLFRMGGSLDASDRIDGGTGRDSVWLNGDYSAGLVFDDATIVNVERMHLGGHFDYNLTMADGNVAAGERLTIDAGELGASHHFIFDGAAETDGSFKIVGGAGGDDITGSAQADIIALGQGGNDTAAGGGGDDQIYMDGAFDDGDVIDGGTGNDTVQLLGTYGGFGGPAVPPFLVSGENIANVETLKLFDGLYALQFADSVVAANQTLTVDGSRVTSDLMLDASAESNGHYAMIGGTGDDTMSGGGQSDTFDLTHGGTDTVHAGGGDDTITLGAAFNCNANAQVTDQLDGGAGFDTVILDGDFGLVQLIQATFTSVEDLVLKGPHDYRLQGDDGNVAAGQFMIVDGSDLDSNSTLDFFGSSETDGSWILIGGGAADQLHGGAGDDSITGGGGGDLLVGNGGADSFVYTQVSDSTGPRYDTIDSINFSQDFILVDTATPAAINATIVGAVIDPDNFNASLAGIVDAAHMGAHNAVLVDVNDGEFAGRVFLVIDHNGTAGYQADQDYVIDVTGFSGSLTTGSFGSFGG